MATHSPDVLIVGAGIGGLTAALAMQQRGLRVVISEQASQLGEVGAGLTLTPNLTRVLYHLELEDALSAIMVVPEIQLIRHWQSGETLVQKRRGQLAIDTYGFPYGHVHRADIHNMLVQAVLKHDEDAIWLGKAAVSAHNNGTSATVMYGDGTHLTAGVVVGADGVRSRVRDSLFKTTPARFTGHVAWRAIVPTSDMAEEAAAAPPGLFLGPGRMFMRYPIRGGSAWNYAAFARQSGWTTDSWTARADVSDPLAMFEGWHDVVTQTMGALCARSVGDLGRRQGNLAGRRGPRHAALPWSRGRDECGRWASLGAMSARYNQHGRCSCPLPNTAQRPL
jgi:salicylate hydroxylase